jgi:alpha-ribazole phosphatase
MEVCSEFIINLYLIRHGMTKANEEKRYIGRTDEPLSVNGKAMLKRAEVPRDTIVFSGPMKRCMETSEKLFPNIRPYVIREWTEIDFGDFEMKNAAELSSDPYYQKWIDSGARMEFPNGEPKHAFRRRTLEGFHECLSIISYQTRDLHLGPGEPITAAAVLHGGNIMILMSALVGRDYFEFMTEPGDGYKLSLTYRDGSYQLNNYRRLGNDIL